MTASYVEFLQQIAPAAREMPQPSLRGVRPLTSVIFTVLDGGETFDA